MTDYERALIDCLKIIKNRIEVYERKIKNEGRPSMGDEYRFAIATLDIAAGEIKKLFTEGK